MQTVVKPFHWKLITAICCFVLCLSSCTWNNEEELYPAKNRIECDTSNISLSGKVKPILDRYCIGCHSTGFASGGVDLERYEELARWANNGKLMSSVRHDGKASPMPKGSPKIDDCKIQQIQLWIDQGAKND